MAVTAADLFDGAAKQDHVVRRLDSLRGPEHELHLAGAELQLDGAQIEAERQRLASQDVGDGLDAIETQLGEVVVALVDQLHLGYRARLAGILEAEPRV